MINNKINSFKKLLYAWSGLLNQRLFCDRKTVIIVRLQEQRELMNRGGGLKKRSIRTKPEIKRIEDTFVWENVAGVKERECACSNASKEERERERYEGSTERKTDVDCYTCTNR